MIMKHILIIKNRIPSLKYDTGQLQIICQSSNEDKSKFFTMWWLKVVAKIKNLQTLKTT